VKIHLHHIYRKVGVPNRTALTRWRALYGGRSRSA
jgi:DNA-binding CsgD family transcriptional regulator